MQFHYFWTLSFKLRVNVGGQATQYMWYQQFAIVITAISFFSLFREACFTHVRIIKGWGGGELGMSKDFLHSFTDNSVEDANEYRNSFGTQQTVVANTYSMLSRIA